MTRIARGAAALAVSAGLAGGIALGQEPGAQPAPPAGRGGHGGPGRFGGPGGPMGWPLAPMFLGRLNLTDVQREQVKSIREPRREGLEALNGRARAAHEALTAAITAEAFNEGLIRARATDVASVDADIAVERGRVHADVLQILTADQKARLKELQAERPERGRRPR